jgi:hypothetical protein
MKSIATPPKSLQYYKIFAPNLSLMDILIEDSVRAGGESEG